MKTKMLLGAALIFAVAIACNKETDDLNTPSPDYFPLTNGSYWVYNTYQIDSSGNENIVGDNDTIMIIGDSLINGNEYKVFYGVSFGHASIKKESYYRDSMDCIVNNEGKIIFSNKNFTDTLSVTSTFWSGSVYWYAIMEPFSGDMVLPAGTFNDLLNSKLTVVDAGKQDIIGTSDYLYAPNVGLVLRQYFYISSHTNYRDYFEERLVDYHIAD